MAFNIQLILIKLPGHLDSNDVLNSLPIAEDAQFNAYQRQHDLTCLSDTRVELLREIYKWADSYDERCIFWLNGLAGTGKSTVARTVAREYFDQKRLAASFFFSRGGRDVGHAGMFVTSIAWQMASNIPHLQHHIHNAFTEHRNITSQSLRDQWQQLVLYPLSKLSENGNQSVYILVVDALDECDNDNNIRIVIHLLAEARSLKTTRLRIFLTSRPEIPIRNGFCQIPDAEHRDFLLHNISPSIVDHDLSIFFEYNFKLIGQEQSLDACWPGEEITKRLIQIAGGLFIWAATACRFIQEGKRFAVRRLDTILSGINSALTAPEKHLDEIYTTVLKQSIGIKFTKEEKEEVYCALRKALGSIVILLSPLSASSLYKLLNVKKEDLDQTLNDLHSVLDIPKDRFQPLRLHHPSFRDYLLDKSRCQDLKFWVNEKQAHQVLADNCLRLMSTSLKQDICRLNAPGKLVAEVDKSQIDHNLPSEVQYACIYWTEHIQKSSAQLYDNDQVHRFLQKHLLHWLEALGWMGKISEGVYAIAALESFATVSISNTIYTFTEHSVSQIIVLIFRILFMTQSGLFFITDYLSSRLQFRLTAVPLYSHQQQV
jgi:NACHT domain